jgi:uncharacterized membrane protein YhaH (DUF805 family)
MLRHLFSLKGRASPGEWWAVTVATGLFNLAGAALLALLVVNYFPPEDDWPWATWTCRVVCCALTLWPIITVNIRRAHDRGQRGLFEGSLAGASVIAWLAFVLTPWTDPLMPAAWLPPLEVLPLLMLIALFYWNGVMPGTQGPNAYGQAAKRFDAVAA